MHCEQAIMVYHPCNIKLHVFATAAVSTYRASIYNTLKSAKIKQKHVQSAAAAADKEVSARWPKGSTMSELGLGIDAPLEQPHTERNIPWIAHVEWLGGRVRGKSGDDRHIRLLLRLLQLKCQQQQQQHSTCGKPVGKNKRVGSSAAVCHD